MTAFSINTGDHDNIVYLERSALAGTKAITAIDRLIASWRASPDLHSLAEGATEAELDDFEARVGWKLPTEWRELYIRANGVGLGPTEFYPLFGAPSLFRGSQYWRARDWAAPDELWIAGGPTRRCPGALMP